MGPLGAFRTPILAAGLALVVVAGCSSSAKKSTPTTTSSSSTSSSSAPETSTSEPAASSTTTGPTTTLPAATTTTTQSSVRITGYTVSPATPVCNGPTMIQLTWTTVGATQVLLLVDGALFATYGGGSQTHLEYYACDGHPHTYSLRATGSGVTAVASKTVTSTSS
jgi:hypothetical protein